MSVVIDGSYAQWLRPLEELVKELPANCWVAGGAVRSHLCGEKPKDIDIFSKDPDTIVAAFEAADNYTKTFGNEFFQNFKKGDTTYQVIKKYQYDSPQATIDSFDFTVICAAVSSEGLVYNERFFMDNAQKRLVINALPLPLSTLKRALRYATKGYMLCPVSLSRLTRTINELQIDWDNPDQNQIDFYPDGTSTFRGKD